MAPKTKRVGRVNKIILVIVVPFFYGLGYSLFNFPQAFE